MSVDAPDGRTASGITTFHPLRVRAASPDAAGPAIGVLRILGALDTGGIEQRAIELLPGLRAAGVAVGFVTLTGRRGELASLAERRGATVHPIRLDPLFPFRFLRLIRLSRPRAVHSDVATFSGALLLLAWIARVPVRLANFTADHDGHPDTPRRRAQRRLMRWLISRCATHITGVAPGVLTHGYRPNWRSDRRCQVLPTGIDLDRLARSGAVALRREIGATPEELVLITVGRPIATKRRAMLPAIVAWLRAAGIPSRAVLVGPRGEADDARVRDAARRHGVADRIHLLGHRDALGALLRQADLMVAPSTLEGLPGTVLESLAVGTPVLACDLPGTRYIRDRVPGVELLPPEADPQQWAAAIRRLGPHPGRSRDDDAAAATIRESVFSLETSVAQHVALYRGC